MNLRKTEITEKAKFTKTNILKMDMNPEMSVNVTGDNGLMMKDREKESEKTLTVVLDHQDHLHTENKDLHREGIKDMVVVQPLKSITNVTMLTWAIVALVKVILNKIEDTQHMTMIIPDQNQKEDFLKEEQEEVQEEKEVAEEIRVTTRKILR